MSPGPNGKGRSQLGKVIKKVVKIGAIVAGIALAIPTGGTSLLATTLGVSALGAAAIAGGLALASSLLSSKPKAPQNSPADRDRLFANIDPNTPRKIVYGRTAMATDIRDQEYSGADDEYFHRFVVVASHKINAMEQIWFDDKLAWTSTGGVQGEYAGYLTVTPIVEGSAANAINIGSRMGSTRRFTGLAYVHFRYKLTGNNKKTESPFSQSIPTRLTIIGKAMELYDPRKDSTRGGVGSHRIDDQSTWEWDDNACRNPALQLLNYLIGYKINGLLAVGKGIPPARLDIQSFADAANACDEPVSLSGGGTEPRYRTDGIFSEGDDMELVVNQFKSSMNAITDDAGGKIRVIVLSNDLASPVADFDENDILSAVDWKPGPDLGDRFNIVRGTYTNPSDEALYQATEYPEQSLVSPDGIDRIFPLNYPLIQKPSRCERLTKQRIQRAQYGGVLKFVGGSRYWQLIKNDVIRQTFGPLGMNVKVFRVAEITVQEDGTVPITLREEDSSIYAWDQEDSAEPTLAPPDSYDYTKNPLYQDIENVVRDRGQYDAGTEYQLDDVVNLGDGSRWIYINSAPSTGNTPQDGSDYWSRLADPTEVDFGNVTGPDKPENSATVGAIIPSPGTPNPETVGNLEDENGDYINSGEFLHSELEILETGQLQYKPAPELPAVKIGRATPEGLGAATRAAHAQTERSLDLLSSTVIQALSRISDHDGLFRDAGITIDPGAGTVTIHGIEQTKERLSEAEIRLDGAEANILLRASTTYVDNAIAQAVIDPSQVPVFDQLEVRIATAETDIDGLQSSITSKASVIDLNAVSARVTTAESDIDALEGAITSKVESATFDALETRVTSTESTLSAIGDTASITQAVSSVRRLRRDVDANAQETLGALLQNERDHRQDQDAIAAARTELTALTNDGLAAEATKRSSLETQVADNKAAAESATKVVSDEQSSLAGQVDTLSASTTTSFSEVNQAIVDESAARIAAINQEAQDRIDGIALEASDRVAAIQAEADARGTAITAEEQARITEINAQAINTANQIAAEQADRVAAIAAERQQTEADIAAEAVARGNEIAAQAAILSADIANEAQARTDGDGALAGQITAITASLATETQNRIAAVDSEEQARVDADGSLLANIRQDAATVRTIRRDNDAIAQRALNALLNGEENRLFSGDQIAAARQELGTRITGVGDNLALEAARIAALLVRMGSAEASITEKDLLRISGDEALAQSIDTLSTTVNSNKASFDSQISTLTDADSALSQNIVTITASFNQDISDVNAALSDEETARIAQVNAEADARIAAINAERLQTVSDVSTETSNREAAILGERTQTITDVGAVASDLQDEVVTRDDLISQEQAQRTAADDAEIAARIAAVNTERDNRIAAITGVQNDLATETTARQADITSVQQAIADGDNVLAGRLDTVETTVGSHSASITQFAISINGLETRWGVETDVNGRVSGIILNNDGTRADLEVVVDSFRIWGTGVTSAVAPFEVTGGQVFIKDALIQSLAVDKIAPGTLGSDITVNGNLNMGTGKIIFDNGSHMLANGVGFGDQSQFILWFGPSCPIDQCTAENANFYLDTSGNGIYGLALGSNFIKNSGSSTSTDTAAQTTVGPFSTQGNPKQVYVSFNFHRQIGITNAANWSGVSNAQIIIERSLSGVAGTFAYFETLNVNGVITSEDGNGPTEPGFILEKINGVVQSTDNTSGTTSFTYRARLASRNNITINSAQNGVNELSQNITLISTEAL